VPINRTDGATIHEWSVSEVS